MYEETLALRSVLNPRYLAAQLSGQYDLGPWSECVYWLRGLNDTYRVRAESGLYILRIYRTEIAEADVAYETEMLIQLTTLLQGAGTAVAEPIAMRDGGWYTILDAPEGRRAAVLFRYMDLPENGLMDEASCFAFGKSAAELHAAMDNVKLWQPRMLLDTDFLIEKPLQRIIHHIGKEHKAVPFLRRFARELHTRVSEAAEQGLDWGLCHGDMHGNNNAFQNSSGFVHYDFEWAVPGWRAYDLAQVRVRKRQPEANQELLWQAVLAGYRSIRDFSKYDEAAVELFTVVRRWWVMGLDVMFVPNDMGALDYGEDWLRVFLEEFKSTEMTAKAGLKD
ncbi:phosphotransferase enzyme family protein [Paenibacillus paeoniae]|uniref:Aminoglycoside phosphotransferase n=1 Tax=Paenibacillus paeoniae TaxID=2292705 RepID=A0A371P5Q7_9BACL|nr:phosphotransferase [Paenibacillus paeoniae]REK71294.1 aminoglycoside phosphotransferase [Paenibacillus paeoniae]